MPNLEDLVLQRLKEIYMIQQALTAHVKEIIERRGYRATEHQQYQLDIYAPEYRSTHNTSASW